MQRQSHSTKTVDRESRIRTRHTTCSTLSRVVSLSVIDLPQVLEAKGSNDGIKSDIYFTM